jgi:hypothetical protein
MNKKQSLKCLTLFALGLLASQLPASAFYNPTAGRWLSRDPVGEVAFTTLNLKERSWAERKRLRLEALKPTYVFVHSDAINRLDILGLTDGDTDCPGLPQGQNNATCYQYACGNYGKWSDSVGGRGGKRCVPPYTCDSIRKGALADGMTEVPADGKCPEGTHKVAYALGSSGGSSDFHWLRQNDDGSWCHKNRYGGVSNLDGNKQVITDPANATLSFPAQGNWPAASYKLCDKGYLCAPNSWK